MADYLDRHRTAPKYFTRQRKLPFPQLVGFLMNSLKRPLQDELDSFFDRLHLAHGSARQYLSKAALSKARKKVSHTAFIELNQRANHQFYKDFPCIKRWHGHRLLAVDGSKLKLPEEPSLAKQFGRSGEGQAPMALLSTLYDVLNQRTIDAQLRPYASSERECVIEHMWHTETDDLILYDRGYPGFWLFALHREYDRKFCMRLPWNIYNQSRDFYLDKDQTDTFIELTSGREARAHCEALGIDASAMRLRLIRVELDAPNAEGQTSEILITNLCDSELYPKSLFGELYHQRWGTEEGYKALKHRADLENWSGRSVEVIYQDIQLKLLNINMSSLNVATAELRREERVEKRKQKQKRAVNRSAALSRQKDTLLDLLWKRDIRTTIEALIERISQITEAVRPGRAFSRKPRPAAGSRYRSGYKPLR